MRLRIAAIWGILIGFFCIGFCSCGGSYSLSVRNVEGRVEFKKVAVVPFHVIHAPEGEVMARSPISGEMFRTGPVEGNAEDILTDLLNEQLKADSRFIPLAKGEITDLRKELRERENWSMGPVEKLTFGKDLDADAVLLGFIYEFRERVGTSYSAETPASVCFDLYLLKGDSGQILWKAAYTRSQEPVTSNILNLGDYLSEGIKWMTVEQLAKVGITKMLEKFPASIAKPPSETSGSKGTK